MIIVIADVDEVATLLNSPRSQDYRVVRPQTSGPCVHCEDGTPYRCTYPYGDGACPHLDNPEVLCPVKDACYAMWEVARLRSACEAEQEEQDQATADETEPAEGRETPRGRRWTSDEDTVLQLATSAAGAQGAYQEVFPGSERTPAAISSRWYKVRRQSQTPTTDFSGDTVPVTQCEGTVGKGFYGGDSRAYEADLLDGMMCDRPLSQEPEEAAAESNSETKPRHPWIGMRVRILDPLDLINRTGTVVQYNPTPQEMLVALDGSLDRVWLPPESLLLIGAGRTRG